MKRITSPAASSISLSTALRRSSNSPRYLAPASRAPTSSATTRLPARPLGDVAGHDALGQALDDGGLAGAGLADQHRVVLGAPREDLDDAADLLVAPDHRVELAALGGLGEVAAVLLERLVLGLGVGVGDAGRAAHGAQGGQQAVARHAAGGQGLAGRAGLLEQRQQQVLGRDELVVEALRLGARAAQHRAVRVGELGAGRRPADLRAAPDGGLGGRAQGRHVGLRLAQHRLDHALGRVEQRQQQVVRLHDRVAALRGDPGGPGDRLLGALGGLVNGHSRSSHRPRPCLLTTGA